MYTPSGIDCTASSLTSVVLQMGAATAASGPEVDKIKTELQVKETELQKTVQEKEQQAKLIKELQE